MKRDLLLGVLFIFSLQSSGFRDPILSGGPIGNNCETSNGFYEQQATYAAQSAAYICLAFSLSGVQPGSVLDLCAGARNDEKLPQVEVDRYVNALTNGAGCASLRLTRGTQPGKEIQAHLNAETAKVCDGKSYASSRESVLNRLREDLRASLDACTQVPLLERQEVLRKYEWGKATAPDPQALFNCRDTFHGNRKKHGTVKLSEADEQLIALLESTPRFIERVRGFTLQPDKLTLNWLDLHYMAAQAFELLSKRVDFISSKEALSEARLEQFANNDPDFAQGIACHAGIKKEFPLIAHGNHQATETFKKKVLEQFVWPYVRANRFSGAEQQYIDESALEQLVFLIGSDQFQRAIWLFEEHLDSLEMREFFEKMTKGKRFEKSELREHIRNKGLGANESYRTTLPFGLRGIFKPFNLSNPNPRMRENFRGELAVNEIDKILALRTAPLTVNLFIDGKEGSFQFFVTHAQTPANMDLSKSVQMGEGIAKKSWQINLLDVLALNPDRQSNLANMMIVIGEQKAVPIDNGLAFTAKKNFPNVELRYPKKDSIEFIPKDLAERRFLSKRLDNYLTQLSNSKIQLHDDERLNQCGKIISQAAASALNLMAQKCGTRSDQECNELGADHYNVLTNDPGFLKSYNSSKCGS